MVSWYQQGWQIEQLFRTLERQGLGLESRQLEPADALLKLACIATLAAARTLQLVNAGNGQTPQLVSTAFDDDNDNDDDDDNDNDNDNEVAALGTLPDRPVATRQ